MTELNDFAIYKIFSKSVQKMFKSEIASYNISEVRKNKNENDIKYE